MKPKQRNSIIVLAIVCMMVFPGIANAATIYYNLKINFSWEHSNINYSHIKK